MENEHRVRDNADEIALKIIGDLATIELPRVAAAICDYQRWVNRVETVIGGKRVEIFYAMTVSVIPLER